MRLLLQLTARRSTAWTWTRLPPRDLPAEPYLLAKAQNIAHRVHPPRRYFGYVQESAFLYADIDKGTESGDIADTRTGCLFLPQISDTKNCTPAPRNLSGLCAPSCPPTVPASARRRQKLYCRRPVDRHGSPRHRHSRRDGELSYRA